MDRFHLAIHYREGADKLRRAELKQLKGATWAYRNLTAIFNLTPL